MTHVAHIMELLDGANGPTTAPQRIDGYQARCVCGWSSRKSWPSWGKAHQDATRHIGQMELPDPPPVLPIFA